MFIGSLNFEVLSGFRSPFSQGRKRPGDADTVSWERERSGDNSQFKWK